MPIYKLVYCSKRAENRQEVVRWNSGTGPGSVTWDELIAKIKTLFNGHYPDYLVTWFDGTDVCTIGNGNDLRDAEEEITSSSNFEGFIRLFIAPVRDSVTAAEVPIPVTKSEPHPKLSNPSERKESTSIVHPKNVSMSHCAHPTSNFGYQSMVKHSFVLPPHPQQRYNQQHHEHEKQRSLPKETVLPSSRLKPKVNTVQKGFKSKQRATKMEVSADEEPCYMRAKLEVLKAMGYTQDEDTMKVVLRKYYGDINRVVDYMSTF